MPTPAPPTAAPVTEGIIHFEVTHEARALDERRYGETARLLAAWREIMARLGVLGLDPERYEGLAYGNVSARLGPFGEVPRGRRRFLVSGTQTGGQRRVTLADFCVVESYDVAANRVSSFGLVPPSSESLTHAALYDVAPAARAVLHGHAPEIWRRAKALGIPSTGPDAANGTVAMAREVQRLYRETAFSGMGVLAMSGHEDGVLAIGASLAAAGQALVTTLARALTSEA